MSASETCTTDATGKDIHDGSQLSVDGVHPAPIPPLTSVYPSVGYGDAVHAELVASGIAPDVVEAGVRTEQPGGERELFLTVSWLTGHPDLDGVDQLDLLWSDLTGWVARADGDVHVLAVDDLAAPAVLADAALHLATEGLDSAWTCPADPHRWEHAPALEVALAAWEDQGVDR